MFKELSIKTCDNIELKGHFYKPSNMKAVAWFGHAMMVSGKTYERKPNPFINEFLKAGIGCYVIDFRGHGLSKTKTVLDYSINYDDFVMKDIPSIIQRIKNDHPKIPFISIGHSLASHTLLAWAGSFGLLDEKLLPDAIITLACNIWLPSFEPNFILSILKRHIMRLFHISSIPLGYFPSIKLNIGTDNVSIFFIKDMLRFCETSKWESKDKKFNYLENLSKIPKPVLAIGASGDLILASEKSLRKFHESIPHNDIYIANGSSYKDNPSHMDLVINGYKYNIPEYIIDWCKNKNII